MSHHAKTPWSPSNASAGGGPHSWNAEETAKMMELANSHIVASRGHNHVDWNAVARDMHAAGFERSASALAAHYRTSGAAGGGGGSSGSGDAAGGGEEAAATKASASGSGGSGATGSRRKH
jgi:hypothetical protein